MLLIRLIIFALSLTFLFLLIWFITKNKIYLKITGYFWLGLFGFMMSGTLVGIIWSQKKLTRSDYNGQYIIDRSYFKGKQTDWQYDNFQFEIKDNDSIYFYVSDKDKISHTFKGTVSTIKPYHSERLVVTMIQPTHPILMTNPTVYRDTWSFHLVFNSPKFGNMNFKKGQWEPIDRME
ncbi:MAG: hypothetical protein JWM14_3383 [Chitinophagaceae bacterium]|nr:hypothetical protein [Chitinophagaceae bacterium]